MRFEAMDHRSIQVGLSGVAVIEGLLGGWIVRIEDFTERARRIGELVNEAKEDEARELLPEEKVYSFLADEARVICGADLT